MKAGITGGCDLECGSFYPSHIVDSVNHNILSEKDVDIAVKRVWKRAFMLGMLDDNVSYK